MRFLAGELLHRSALTEEEHRAAEYIRARFNEYTPDVETDPFRSIENPFYVFASYYGEFLVVAVLAIWWPRIALCYGGLVLLAYLAEFMGYPVFSRFLPHFESQNVVARFLGTQPKATIIVTAHYDSGRASPISRPGVTQLLRVLHLVVIGCMVTVMTTCAVDALHFFNLDMPPLHEHVRWTAVGVLLSAALALFYASASGEEIRGANYNASGVAAMLRLAHSLASQPLETADVWLAATGSNETWMAGMRHLLSTHALDKKHTYILNIEGVGAGQLHYLTAEGMLQLERASSPMLSAAAEVDGPFGATPGCLRAVPTAAHAAMARGLHTLTVIGLDESGLPAHWNRHTDLLTEVDDEAIANAAGFCEALLRKLERSI